MLAIIILIGFILRLLYFKEITFGYDQARDALEAIAIWTTNHLKVIGPTSDLPGVNHGVLYWYLISPFYYFSHGNVYLVKFILILFNLINIWFVYFFAYKIFENKKIALFSAFMMATSFEAIQYARWMSNPSPGLLSVAVFYYGIFLILNNKKYGIPLTLMALSVSVHFEFFLIYLFAILFVTLFYKFTISIIRNHDFNKNSLKSGKRESILLSILSFIIFFPFIIKELKFDFRTIRALISFFNSSGSFAFERLSNLIPRFIEKISFNAYYNLWGISFNVAGIYILALSLSIIILYLRRVKYRNTLILLLIWLYSPLILYLFERSNAYFLNIGNSYPLILLSAYLFCNLITKITNAKYRYFAYLVFVIVIAYGNIKLIIQNNKNGELLFSVQEQNILSDELKVVDFTYQESKGQPFRIDTITNPLFINTTWAFLYAYYGMVKYGYMPEWGGYPQEGEGVFGKEIQFSKYNDDTKILYLIIEPSSVFPPKYLYSYEKFENQRSKIIKTQGFGKHVVERRELNKLIYFSRENIFQYSLEFKEK